MLGVRHTRIANVDVWAGDQLVHFGRRTAAPCAGGIDSNTTAAPGAAPPTAARRGYDLLNALVAEIEPARDLAERASPQMQPADGRVIVASRQEGIALGGGEALGSGTGCAEKVRVKRHGDCLSRLVRFVYYD